MGIEGDRVPQVLNALHCLTLAMQNDGEVMVRLGQLGRPCEHGSKALLCPLVVSAQMELDGASERGQQVAGRAGPAFGSGRTPWCPGREPTVLVNWSSALGAGASRAIGALRLFGIEWGGHVRGVGESDPPTCLRSGVRP